MVLTEWWILCGGVALGLGISLACAATGALCAGLALGLVGRPWSVSLVLPTAPPPLLLSRPPLLPADVYERPALRAASLPYAPGPASKPYHVIPGRVDVSAPTEVDHVDEVPPASWAVVVDAVEGTIWVPGPGPVRGSGPVGTGLEYRGRPGSASAGATDGTGGERG